MVNGDDDYLWLSVYEQLAHMHGKKL